MMNKINYNNECLNIIETVKGEDKTPSLLLHSCCAPCSSYCLLMLSEFFKITVFYYNPNIFPKEEFEKRAREQKRLIGEMQTKNEVNFVCPQYDYSEFLEVAKGYENCKEGGERCFRCYEARMKKAAQYAKENGFDYFCTTLSISPLKNAQKINEIGFEIEKISGVKWLPSDFKKQEGYKRSIELSHKYNLYRQNFCGCVYSKEKSIDE